MVLRFESSDSLLLELKIGEVFVIFQTRVNLEGIINGLPVKAILSHGLVALVGGQSCLDKMDVY